MARGGSNEGMIGGMMGLVIAIVIGAVIYIMVTKEKFVPTKPSQYQDKRYVTPAGNTIVY